MKTVQFVLIFFIATVVFPFTIWGQTQTTVSGELRLRPELRRGFRTLPDSSSKLAGFVDQRARLSFQYQRNGVQLVATLQEARTWGQDVQASRNPSLGLFEFYGVLPVAKSLQIKAGRQKLSYDNERLLGELDWLAQGRSHDVAVLKWKGPHQWLVDAGFAFNQNHQPFFGTYYALDQYKMLNFLWANKSWKDSIRNVSLSGLFVADAFQKKDTSGVYMRLTYGINGVFTQNKISVSFEAYGQSGKDNNGRDIGAWMFSVAPTFQPLAGWSITPGLDAFSGTDQSDPASVQQGTFSTLYPTPHRYCGIADYFLNIITDTKEGGLLDAYFKVSRGVNKWTVHFEYHHFRLQSLVLKEIASDGSRVFVDKNLGHEFDLWGSLAAQNEVSVMFGGSIVLGTESLAFIRGGSADQLGFWLYSGIRWRPNFLLIKS